MSLENWIKKELDKLEEMADFEVATETVRCWIDEWKDSEKSVSVSDCDCGSVGGLITFCKRCCKNYTGAA